MDIGRMAEELTKQGYTQDQVLEIEKGLKAGIDISHFADKKFLAIQMRQIRIGIQEGLEVEKYASFSYDWFQMEEIRKGLLGKLDVDKYASPDIPYDKMRQIRWGLCAGIDLSAYKKLSAGILKELRLAIENRVNIIPYINAGYDTEQLEVIRAALEQGLDIDPWLRKEYRGISIEEICKGLKVGLDVSTYAGTEYSWQQMREIRLGMEHMVDIEKYKSPYYSAQQMREIRLGLEEGLEVSYYRSLMYTAKEMEGRRLALKENPAAFMPKEEVLVSEQGKEGHYRIRISEDEMEAFLEVAGGEAELNRTEILKALRNHDIVYGILYDEIENMIHQKNLRKPVLIARGKPTIGGEDGRYEFFFRTQVARTPKELEHGNVDYRNVEWFETVQEGQKLAYYHSATPGENGITVTGKNIPAKRGREQSILTGSGFKRMPDGKTYISLMQGIVTLHEFCLEVANLLIMDKVNLSTGNVNFRGNVYVKGNVGSGTRIQADGDVFVKGFVESAEIVCGGNAVLRQGMNASGNGYINAGKDVIGYFFEATEVYAKGNIQGDYFLNCRLYAEEKVIASGKKGMLAGGSTFAEKGLRVYTLGNQAGLFTQVKLGLTERFAKEEEDINMIIRGVNKELFILQNALMEFQRKYPAEVRNTMELYLKTESAIYTKERQMEGLLRDKSKLADERRKTDLVSAIIDKQLYEGVTFEIDGSKWNAKNVGAVTVKKKNNKIAVFSN